MTATELPELTGLTAEVGPGRIPAADQPRSSLSDWGAVAVAVAVAAGAWWHGPVPLPVGVLVVALCLVVRRPVLLVLAGFVLAASLGQRAIDGLDPAAPGDYAGTVVLLADPSLTPYGAQVDVRVGERHLQMDATGGAAGAVAGSLAGERLLVSGRVGPPLSHAPWLVPRHVVGRLSVEQAERVNGGTAPWQAANRFRRLLARGAAVLLAESRSLYGGFVLGDDWDQPPAVIDDFRGAGLTHLLVVSGQNVAFVLVLFSPLTSRLRLGSRWAVTLVVIGGFGILARFEPSVLRASAMAALAVTAALAGRPAGSLRVLALAVSGLVLVDPLLVQSVGFQLSVGASLGIAMLGPTLVSHIRGPMWWREALGVSLAAQLGVAPVLVPRFGGIPVVSIPANVLAVPVAGLVTTWGLPAGIIAGLGGPGVARVAHMPTQILIWWVAGVARVAAAVPLGEFRARGLILLVAAAVVGHTARRRPVVALEEEADQPLGGPGRDRWWAARWLAGAVAVATVVAPGVGLRSPPLRVSPAEGVTLYRSSRATVMVLDGVVSPRVLLEALRRAGVRRIDVLLAPRQPAPAVLEALRHRWPVGRVMPLDGSPPVYLVIGGLVVDTATSPPLITAEPP